MSYTSDPPSNGRDVDAIVRATRHSISERLSDPYLTEHDRMVLRQFGRFLSGIAPEPDPRAVAVLRAGAPLPIVLPRVVLFEGPRSGTGEVTDWAAAATLAVRTRMILAGGLHADNVRLAMETVRPWGVDVSSGVES